jgi:hypothetical protein
MDFGAYNRLASRNLDKKYLLPSFAVTKDLPGLEGSTALDPQIWALERQAAWLALDPWNWALERQLAGARSLICSARSPPLLQHFNFS